jgi:hypothetical protein
MSNFLSELEDGLSKAGVPVWKVFLLGFCLVGVFVGSFILYFKLWMWLL